MNVVTDSFNSAAMANLTGTAAPLTGLYLALFTNTPVLGNGMVTASFTEPTFNGYSRKAISFSPVFRQPDTSFAVQGGNSIFQMTDTLAPTTIQGYFVATSTSVAGGTTYWAEYLPSPVGLNSTTDAVIVSPQMEVPNFQAAKATVIS